MSAPDPIEFDHVADQLRARQLNLYSKAKTYRSSSRHEALRIAYSFAHIADYYDLEQHAVWAQRVMLHGSPAAVNNWSVYWEQQLQRRFART